MPVSRKRTTLTLSLIMAAFILILVLMCLLPYGGPAGKPPRPLHDPHDESFYKGKSPEVTPEVIIATESTATTKSIPTSTTKNLSDTESPTSTAKTIVRNETATKSTPTSTDKYLEDTQSPLTTIKTTTQDYSYPIYVYEDYDTATTERVTYVTYGAFTGTPITHTTRDPHYYESSKNETTTIHVYNEEATESPQTSNDTNLEDNESATSTKNTTTERAHVEFVTTESYRTTTGDINDTVYEHHKVYDDGDITTTIYVHNEKATEIPQTSNDTNLEDNESAASTKNTTTERVQVEFVTAESYTTTTGDKSYTVYEHPNIYDDGENTTAIYVHNETATESPRTSNDTNLEDNKSVTSTERVQIEIVTDKYYTNSTGDKNDTVHEDSNYYGNNTVTESPLNSNDTDSGATESRASEETKTTEKVVFETATRAMEMFPTTEKTSDLITSTKIQPESTYESITVTEPYETTISVTTVIQEEPTTAKAPSATEACRREDEVPVCNTQECKQVAARMLNMIDHSADPCDDFYQYACGGVEDNVFMQPIDPEVDVANRLHAEILKSPEIDNVGEHAKVFFSSCLARAKEPGATNVDPLRKEVNRMGRLDPRPLLPPVLGPDPFGFIDEDKFDLTAFLADGIARNVFTPFFDVGLDMDAIDGYIAKISLPEAHSLFSEDLEESFCAGEAEDRIQEIVERGGGVDFSMHYSLYRRCLEADVSKLGHGVLFDSMHEATSALQIVSHINDTELAYKLVENTIKETQSLHGSIRNTWPSRAQILYELRNADYHIYSIDKLSSVLGDAVNWSLLLGKILGIKVDNYSKVHVYHESAIKRTMEILKIHMHQSKPRLRNYLLTLLSNKMYTDFMRPIRSGTDRDYCLKLTKALMPDISGILYLQSFSAAHRNEANRKVDNIVSAIKNTVVSSLDPELSTKVQYIYSRIGAGVNLEEYRNQVNESYVLVLEYEQFIENCLQLMANQRREQYFLLKESKNPSNLAMTEQRLQWSYFSNLLSTSASYLYGSGEILVPQGVLTPPFIYPDLASLPDYITYAGIGNIISQQFLRSLDSTAMKVPTLSLSPPQPPRMLHRKSQVLGGVLRLNMTAEMKENSLAILQLSEDENETEHRLNELMSYAEAASLAWMAYENRNKEGPAVETVHAVYDEGSRRRRRREVSPSIDSDTPLTVEPLLPWLNMTQYQLYLLKTAQTQCRESSQWDLINVMESERLPARLRVNLRMMLEPSFSENFHCPAEKMMNSGSKCPSVLGRSRNLQSAKSHKQAPRSHKQAGGKSSKNSSGRPIALPGEEATGSAINNNDYSYEY